MKLLLVTLDKKYKQSLTTHFKPLGVDCIHYKDAIKAMDNMEEIEPEYVLYNAENYPRHWKIMHAMLRDLWTKDECAFILLTPDNFPEEEEKKAKHLEVSAILRNSLETEEDINALKVMFKGYIQESARISQRSSVLEPKRQVPKEKMVLMFTHPGTFQLITGKIKEYSLTEAIFEPDNIQNIKTLKQGLELSNCSLKVGKTILTVDCKVQKNKRECLLTFTRFHGDGKKELKASLTDKS